MRALKAGKHVLLEKPAANTSEEAAKMFALAKEKNLVLLEAFHHRCVPLSLAALGDFPNFAYLYHPIIMPRQVPSSHANSKVHCRVRQDRESERS
jgi:hypothetical protein